MCAFLRPLVSGFPNQQRITNEPFIHPIQQHTFHSKILNRSKFISFKTAGEHNATGVLSVEVF